MQNWQHMIYLGAMYVEVTRESSYVEIGGKMIVGKEKNHVFTKVRII